MQDQSVADVIALRAEITGPGQIVMIYDNKANKADGS